MKFLFLLQCVKLLGEEVSKELGIRLLNITEKDQRDINKIIKDMIFRSRKGFERICLVRFRFKQVIKRNP